MNQWSLFSILIILAGSFFSCHTSRNLSFENKGPSTIVFDKINSDSVYKRITQNQDLKFLTAKGHIQFSNNKENLEGKITLYEIKDSFYLVIIKKLGIELSRILITKDSFKILDRINENFYCNAMDAFIQKFNIPLEFTDIHQLLTSGCFLDASIYYEFKKDRKNSTLKGFSELQTLSYQLDTFNLLPYSFEAKYENRDLHVEVQKSKTFSGKWIPIKYEITASNSKNEFVKIKINWDEIKLDPITSVRFIIPDYYTKSVE